MTLCEIRNYLKKERQATLQQIAGHFNADASQVGPLLEHWMRKGHVVSREGHTHTEGCCGKCSRSGHSWFEWVE